MGCAISLLGQIALQALLVCVLAGTLWPQAYPNQKTRDQQAGRNKDGLFQNLQ